MRAVTHEFVGVGSAVVAAQAVDLAPAPTVGLVQSAVVGTRLPDVDFAGARVHCRTLFERRLWPVHLVGTIARLPLRVGPLFRHRGVTHSLPACAVLSLLVGMVASLAGKPVGLLVGSGIAIGSVAHIAADACTIAGVCPWVPFKRSHVWLLPAGARIRTGSVGELGFAIVLRSWRPAP